MDINIIREEPVRPPISSVIIYLNEREAKDLMLLFGSLSTNKIKDICRLDNDHGKAERIRDLSGLAYDILNDELNSF